MKCGNCGNEVKETEKFCPSCGSDLKQGEAKKSRASSTRSKKPMFILFFVLLVLVSIGLFLGYQHFYATGGLEDVEVTEEILEDGDPIEGEWIEVRSNSGYDDVHVDINAENQQTVYFEQLDSPVEGKIHIEHQLEEVDDNVYEIGEFISARMEIYRPAGEEMPTEHEVDELLDDEEGVEYEIEQDSLSYIYREE